MISGQLLGSVKGIIPFTFFPVADRSPRENVLVAQNFKRSEKARSGVLSTWRKTATGSPGRSGERMLVPLRSKTGVQCFQLLDRWAASVIKQPRFALAPCVSCRIELYRKSGYNSSAA